ncbi:hypothetical protein G7Y89_g5614 [Cudoniella acicularis]|uniref:WSC domain-containing protein n=1 Tax=Cudoniella acicularis TaxID=354080 RepID=A0A8H4RPB4_9HELO|nr:hypothetical protein G7Y89_g5614 [Cudoniella acicularis]
MSSSTHSPSSVSLSSGKTSTSSSTGSSSKSSSTANPTVSTSFSTSSGSSKTSSSSLTSVASSSTLSSVSSTSKSSSISSGILSTSSSLSSFSRVTSSSTFSSTSKSSSIPSGVSSTSSSSSSSTHVASSSTLSTVSSSSQSSSMSSGVSPTSSSFQVTTTSSTSLSPTISSSTISTSSAPAASWSGTPAIGTTIDGLSYLGCVAETSPRTLMSASYSDTQGMTIESCAAFCFASNYGLAGVEYAQECYCGNVLLNGGVVGATGCTMPCKGNSAEYCGGSVRISLFDITYYVPPSSPQVVQNYVYQGCYHEPAQGGRLLSGPSYVDQNGMTVESCVSFCQSQTPTQTWAGVEYAQECYCSTALPAGAVLEPDGTCATLCRGNDKEFCGGNSVLDVYNFSPGKKTRRRTARRNNGFESL